MFSSIDGRGVSGQATVEAVFLIPVLFVGLLMLLQPGIILYDRTVMQAAAADGCRMLATRGAAADLDEDAYRASVLRHLGAIPPQEVFHIHENGCSWEIKLSGDETKESTKVRIVNKVRPLPLLDVGAVLLGMVDDSGNLEIEVEVEMPTQNSWVKANSAGLDPRAWVNAWDEEA